MVNGTRSYFPEVPNRITAGEIVNYFEVPQLHQTVVYGWDNVYMANHFKFKRKDREYG